MNDDLGCRERQQFGDRAEELEAQLLELRAWRREKQAALDQLDRKIESLVKVAKALRVLQIYGFDSSTVSP